MGAQASPSAQEQVFWPLTQEVSILEKDSIMAMQHGESIYNLIPPPVMVTERPPMHKSKHSGTLPPTCSTFHVPGTSHPHTSNMAGDMGAPPVPSKGNRTFGKVPGALKDDP